MRQFLALLVNPPVNPESPIPMCDRPKPIDPPQSWPADMRARWPEIPTDLQVFIRERERQMHRGLTIMGERMSQLRKRADRAGGVTNG